MHKKVFTEEAPRAVGPYSQAIVAKGQKLIFVSGQIPLDPRSLVIEATDVREQTKVVLNNLSAVLKASDAGPQDVVKTTVYLKNMDDFAIVNEEYEQFFSEHKPARVCVGVSCLPKGALVEIDAIAVI